MSKLLFIFHPTKRRRLSWPSVTHGITEFMVHSNFVSHLASNVTRCTVLVVCLAVMLHSRCNAELITSYKLLCPVLTDIRSTVQLRDTFLPHKSTTSYVDTLCPISPNRPVLQSHASVIAKPSVGPSVNL